MLVNYQAELEDITLSEDIMLSEISQSQKDKYYNGSIYTGIY